MDYQALSGAYLQSQGYDANALKNPNTKDLATMGLSLYLQSLGVPAPLANIIAKTAVDKVLGDDGGGGGGGDGSGDNPPSGGGGGGGGGGGSNPTSPEAVPSVEPMIPKDVELEAPTGEVEESSLTNVSQSNEHLQEFNEAIDIDRYMKDLVMGFLPPMNWWDMLPDWPAISYTSIIMDQTRAAKKYILEGIPEMDDVEAEIESHKYPYKSVASSTLMKGKVDPGSRSTLFGHEILQMEMDKDTVKDTEPVVGTIPLGIVTETTQVNAKYFPIAPIWSFPEVYRDDLTDQKNPALDLVDMQNLVDEFLDIGKRIYDSQTENPTIFGFDDINSLYEKDKNIVLANYKAFKANVRRMEHLNNIVEMQGNNYLIENINYRHDIPNCSLSEEYWTRYLREKLLAWYNEEADPMTKVWDKHHWLPGEPGYVVYLLTVGDYEWYDNLVAGLEDSVARLEDLEATIDLLASMANALGTWAKYLNSIEIEEMIVEMPNWDFENTVTFTNEVIDWTMLKELLGVSEIIGSLGGMITPIRAELESLRAQNQGILEEVRIMSPTFLAFPIIWTRLDELASQVISDIHGPLNTLILDLRGDHETVGKHSSPSHLALHIHDQLSMIVETVTADVINIIIKQASLPMTGLHRLDSMLNKINEIRMWGPLCGIPWHYWMAIDNVNAAERLYNDIWSDVFDCWEREYIIRNWRIITEHHVGGVIPATFYGKPLFSAQCPHHLPLLFAPVPVDYRDIDINYLSANCRKNFNFLTSWLTSTLYALGVKRVALGNVINDSSLNGDDANLPYLAELNMLNDNNNTIKDEIDTIISQYNGTSPLLQKEDMDKIIAAKELSPTRYSNQVLLNMSSQLHLLNTDPVTVLKVATNENRMGTIVDNSPALEWRSPAVPESSVEAADISPEIDVLTVTTIPTVGGPAEIVIDTGVSADQSASATGAYVGNVPEFEPWYYMTPDWDTQRPIVPLPVIVPPETAPVIPEPQEVEMPEVAIVPENPVMPIEVEASVIPGPPVRTARSGAEEKIITGGMTLDESAAKKMDMVQKFMQGFTKHNLDKRDIHNDKKLK